MSTPRTTLIILFLCTTLACSFLAPTTETPQTSKNATLYQNGIEVEVLPNGVLSIIDRQGNYGIALPNHWNAGPVSMEFAPSVDIAANTNPFVSRMFEILVDGESHERIFAFDTSPEHLNEEMFSFLTVSMSRDNGCTSLSITEIGNAAINNELNENPYTEILSTTKGESKYKVPWYFYQTKIEAPNIQTFYGGFIVANTGETCIKINYGTNNASIKIEDELLLTIENLAGIAK